MPKIYKLKSDTHIAVENIAKEKMTERKSITKAELEKRLDNMESRLVYLEKILKLRK